MRVGVGVEDDVGRGVEVGVLVGVGKPDKVGVGVGLEVEPNDLPKSHVQYFPW